MRRDRESMLRERRRGEAALTTFANFRGKFEKENVTSSNFALAAHRRPPVDDTGQLARSGTIRHKNRVFSNAECLLGLQSNYKLVTAVPILIVSPIFPATVLSTRASVSL